MARRRNAGDASVQELERRWRTGDQQAGAALAWELHRRGQLTLEWIVALGPLVHGVLETLDFDALEAAAFALTRTRGGISGAKARILVGQEFDENWFPQHRSVDACPRGHTLRSVRRLARGGASLWSQDTLEASFIRVTGYDVNEATNETTVLLGGEAELYDFGDPTFRPPPEPNFDFLVCEAWVGPDGAQCQRPSPGTTSCMARWRVPSHRVQWLDE